MLRLSGYESKGLGQPQSIDLSQHRLTVMGRIKPKDWKEAADTQFILLDSPTLPSFTSRTHCTITRQLEMDEETAAISYDYLLEDMNSMNGLLVNHVKIKSHHLSDNDIIVVGAAKELKVGERAMKDLTGVSDLVYEFVKDPSSAPARNPSGGGNAAPERSQSKLSLKPILSQSNAAAPVRSYSFKPSAKTRKAALDTNNNAAAGPSSEAVSSSTSAQAAVQPAIGDDSDPPKLSLAAQLKALDEAAALAVERQQSIREEVEESAVIASSAAASSDTAAASSSSSSSSSSRPSAVSRKRVREEEDSSSARKNDEDREARENEEKRRKLEFDAQELERMQKENEAKTAAAVEAAVAAATAAAATANAAAQSTATSESRRNFASELSDEFQCAICCDLIVHATALSCSHTYCKSCITQWLKKEKTCPACREKVVGTPVPVKSLDNVIDRIAGQFLTADEQKERKEKQAADSKPPPKEEKKKRGKAAAAPAAAAAAAYVAPIVVDEYDSSEDEDYDEDDDDDDDGEMVLDDDDEDEGYGYYHEHRRGAYDDIVVEHAKSGRAQCRKCRAYIAHGSVRIGLYVRDEMYESTHYYHPKCYKKKAKHRCPPIEGINYWHTLTAPEKTQLKKDLGQ